jgi:metallophosphoesterase (TIGR00282 family)
MKILFIGDIVGRPGREMVKNHLMRLREEYNIDFAIANYENASHGFGLTPKNATELFSYGIDAMTGGNHTWDKKELLPLLESEAILRPFNYPPEVAGRGLEVFEIDGEKLALLNLMGHHGMPMCENPFRMAKEVVEKLHNDGVKNIFVDFHAEATAEKRGMMMLLQSHVSAIVGTHTHVSTDDLHIAYGTAYISDVGLSGCRDNVIGMEPKAPLKQFLTGIKSHYDIPKKCKKILQCVIFEISNGKCHTAQKVKLFDDGRVFKQDAWIEE